MPDKTRKRVRGGMRGKYGSKRTIREKYGTKRTMKSIRRIKEIKSDYPDVLAIQLEKALNKIIKVYKSTNNESLKRYLSKLSKTIIGYVYEDMTTDRIEKIKGNNNIEKLLNMFGAMELIEKNNNNNNNNDDNNKNNMLEEAKAEENPIDGLEILIRLIHKLRRKYLKETNEDKSNNYGIFLIFLGASIQKGIDEYIKPAYNSEIGTLLNMMPKFAITKY